jgi:hypothetical protein
MQLGNFLVLSALGWRVLFADALRLWRSHGVTAIIMTVMTKIRALEAAVRCCRPRKPLIRSVE